MNYLTLNYNHLLYFKTVVDQGSITKASTVLRIGSPAISMQLRHLEEYLGKPLFVRANRTLSLTDTGRVVYDYAKTIFSLGTELLTTLDDQSSGQIKIQIGVQDCVPKNLVSKLTSYIYGHFDSMISVYNGDLEHMTVGVAKHKFDLAILSYSPIIKDKTVLFSRRMLKSPVVLAASPDFMHLKNKPLEKIAEVPFILPMGHIGLRSKIEQYFREQDIEFRLAGEAEDTIIQKNMAIDGNGVIAIMEDAITNYVKTKQLVVLKTLEVHDEVWLVSAKRQIQNPIAEKIMSDFRFNRRPIPE